MAKTNLGSMSVEQLLQLRDDVGKELNRKSTELRSQLARLGGEIASSRGRGGSLKGYLEPALKGLTDPIEKSTSVTVA